MAELGEDFFLAEKSGQWGDAGQSGTADHQGGRCQLQLAAASAADFFHVVGFEVVDIHPGTEEEQRLEKGMGDQVEDAGIKATGRQAHKHEAQLADRGVGQHFLMSRSTMAMGEASRAVKVAM